MFWAWLIFIGFVFIMLALDLGVFHRKSHVVGFKESLGWSAVWITLGLSFSILVYHGYESHWFGLGHSIDAVDNAVNTGKLAATKYLTAYVVEKSLSVDNIFVIATVFAFLGIPRIYQHRVLFWGILGVILFRAVLIGLGFSPLAASGLALIANTAPVAYGALGTPVITLAKVHGYDLMEVTAMIGRQLPFFSLLVPFWLIWAFAGFKAMWEIWPARLSPAAATAGLWAPCSMSKRLQKTGPHWKRTTTSPI